MVCSGYLCSIYNFIFDFFPQVSVRLVTMVSVPEGCPSTSTSGMPVEPTAPAPLKPMALPESSSASSVKPPPTPSPEDEHSTEGQEKQLTLDSAPVGVLAVVAPVLEADTVVEKKKRVPLPVRPASPIELSNFKFQCWKCPTDVTAEFSLSEFFLHQYSAHQVISCIYCDEDFQYAREVMVHLHREHRLNNQKFESDDEFLRRGGGRTTVICVDCNRLLQMSVDTDLNILTNHECRKPPTCEDCGLVLDNITPEHHSQICSQGKEQQSLVTKPKLLEVDECKFCKRKLQHKINGQCVCPVCDRIGLHNLSVKLPVPALKVSLPISQLQLPPIPQLTLTSSTRKTTKAIPPLLPVNLTFGNSDPTNLNSSASESFTLRNKKGSPQLDMKSRLGNEKEATGPATADLSRMNFSSSITVTPLNTVLDDCSGEPKRTDDGGSKQRTNHHHHSTLSQESTDLPRPKRSLKRVTHEDFMYENQLKRRVSTPSVSITPVPSPKSARNNKIVNSNTTKTPKISGNSMQSHVNLDYDIAENGIYDEPTDEWICSKQEQPEVEVPEEILDPLLLEPDSKRRIELLIKELASTLLEKGKTPAAPPLGSDVFPILVSQEDFSEDALLNQMVGKSSADCNYCRQVKLTRVDKRQMLLHLLKLHSWQVRISRPKKGDSLKLENIQQVNKEAKDCGVEKMELDDEPGGVEDAVNEKEDVATQMKGDASGEAETRGNGCGVAEAMKWDPDEKESSPSDPSRSEHDDLDKKEKMDFLLIDPDNKLKGVSPLHEEVTTVVPLLGRKEEVEMHPEEFYLDILGKVFNSDEIIFTFTPPEKTEFGKAPCECLICGSSSNSQLSLFPHWSKAHRGMSMRCPMCHGNFLFAGALFSHVCLGTPQHFVTTPSSGGKVGTGGALELGTAEGRVNDGAERGTANDTSCLRYQCGFCEDLKLPGFFNYMIHLRRDHLSCELCLETLSSQRDLEHHMKKHKSLNHFCWKCSITYLSKPNFMTHLFWKHGTESLECSICLKKKWPHIYHFCIPPPWFTCDVCGLFFTKSKSLLVHKRLHSKEKLRQCPDPECSQKFISSSLLRKHQAAQHETKPMEGILTSEDVKINGCESDESQDGHEAVEKMELGEEPKPEVQDQLESAGGGEDEKGMGSDSLPLPPMPIPPDAQESSEESIVEESKMDEETKTGNHIAEEGEMLYNVKDSPKLTGIGTG